MRVLRTCTVCSCENREVHPGAVPILSVHDEIVVECDDKEFEKAEAWLKKAMINGMDQVLNAPELEGLRVPIEVEAKASKTWAG